jgi:homospermidine synthase
MEAQQFYGHINDICVVGHGSIGKAIIPLIRRHFTFDKMTIIDPHPVFEPKVSEDV